MSPDGQAWAGSCAVLTLDYLAQDELTRSRVSRNILVCVIREQGYPLQLDRLTNDRSHLDRPPQKLQVFRRESSSDYLSDVDNEFGIALARSATISRRCSRPT